MSSKDTVSDFNKLVRALINRLEKKSRQDEEIANLDRLKKRISLLRSTMGDNALIAEAAPLFIDYAEKILESDVEKREKFFLDMDVRGEYIKRKGVIQKQDEFFFTLTDSIRAHYRRAQKKEREEVYAEVKNMLTCCLEYTIANDS